MDSKLPAPIKIMLVDDSTIVRGLMTNALNAEEDIDVVATAIDGVMAIETLKHHAVDVMILDIAMPNMDGLTALPELLRISPRTHIIIASTLNNENAHTSIKAMQMGAADYLEKPTSRTNDDALTAFYTELKYKIRAVGTHKRTVSVKQMSMEAEQFGSMPTPPNNRAYKALALVASTGGPKAIVEILETIVPYYTHIPIFITQHMPPTFTPIFARHIYEATGYEAIEASHGMNVEKGVVYLAPGDNHLEVESNTEEAVCIRLSKAPPINYCRPAADPMLKSLSECYGEHLIITMLTGMGHDGRDGAVHARNKGAHIIAQDEQSSVVWGMPGAVVKAGICDAVLCPNDISTYLIKAITVK